VAGPTSSASASAASVSAVVQVGAASSTRSAGFRLQASASSAVPVPAASFARGVSSAGLFLGASRGASAASRGASTGQRSLSLLQPESSAKLKPLLANRLSVSSKPPSVPVLTMLAAAPKSTVLAHAATRGPIFPLKNPEPFFGSILGSFGSFSTGSRTLLNIATSSSRQHRSSTSHPASRALPASP
jgi:hypothetical protein